MVGLLRVASDSDLLVDKTTVKQNTASGFGTAIVPPDPLVAAPVPGTPNLTIQGASYVFGQVTEVDTQTTSGGKIATAAAGDTTLEGSSGNDVLTGSDGKNTIEGNAGNDIIKGGKGNDTLEGGPGGDVYIFKPEFGKDTITEVKETSPSFLTWINTQATSLVQQTVLGRAEPPDPRKNVIDFSAIAVDSATTGNPSGVATGMTHILSGGELTSGVFSGGQSYALQTDQDSLTGLNFSKGKVEIKDPATGIPAPPDQVKIPNQGLKFIQEIVTGNVDNTLIFGDDWGLNYALGSWEPDLLTAFWSRNQALTIDTSRTVANGKDLTLDFRQVDKQLTFAFEDNGHGGTQLTVSRVTTMPAGLTPSKIFDLLDERGRLLMANGSPQPPDPGERPDTVILPLRKKMENVLGTLLTQTVLGFLDSFVPAEIEYNKLVFTDVGENTIIYGGRDRNTFSMGVPFEGKLVAGGGLRNPAEMLLSADAIAGLAGLNFPPVQVVNTMDLSGTSVVSANLINLGGTFGLERLTDKLAPTAPGLRSDSLANIHNVSVGAGAQWVNGTNAGLDLISPTFNLNELDWGADTFDIVGAPLLSSESTNLAANVFNRAVAATGITQALGLHVMTGMTGSDTYKFDATL